MDCDGAIGGGCLDCHREKRIRIGSDHFASQWDISVHFQQAVGYKELLHFYVQWGVAAPNTG